MSVVDRIRTLIEPALTPLVVDEIKVTPAGKRRVVRIALDRSTDESSTVEHRSEPMSLDEVAEAARAVGEALDASDVLGEQPYTLEVTSSGVGRPLTRPRHYQRGVGRIVVISRDGSPDLRGRILSAGPDAVTVSVPGTTAGAHRSDAPETGAERVETIAYATVAGARIDVEFTRPETDD